MSKEFDLPFDHIVVQGSEALKTCMEIIKDTSKGVTPVILGGVDELYHLQDALEYNDSTPESIIKQSENVNIKDFFNNRYKEFPVDDDMLGEWPEDFEPDDDVLISTIDILTGELVDKVYIALIPTLESYKVPAYLKIGDWNECPSPEEHIAILKYWNEKYGARIVAATHDIIEYIVENPPKTKEEVMELAVEQYKYCIDIVVQGTQTISELAVEQCRTVEQGTVLCSMLYISYLQ